MIKIRFIGGPADGRIVNSNDARILTEYKTLHEFPKDQPGGADPDSAVEMLECLYKLGGQDETGAYLYNFESQL